MPRLTLHFLGPPLIELDGQAVQLGRHKAVALLAYLALTRGAHARDALATLLWPELDQSHARGQLRRTLSLLSRMLGRAWLVVDRETAAWTGDAEAWVDVGALRECLAACAAHGHPIEQACAQCIPLLEEAVDLYRDGFLAGFTLPDAPAFDEWQFFEGEGLRDEVADALQRLARWYGDHGAYELAIPYARQWLALDPLHEPAQCELMTLYARSGQRAAALRQYAECERVLEEELGVPPTPETTALYEAIRTGQELPVVTPAEEAGPSALPTPQRHNLPVQGTPFVGREQELDELDRLLAPTAGARLVTVVGPGGMGKTRLALETAAGQRAHYPDGVWFVPLAPLQSVEAIAPTVAQVLGVSFYETDPPRQQLLRYLREKRMLLVLDNLEHLLEGVDLLVEILRTAPGVRLLVTSRVRLNLREEQVFVLEGIDYPEMRAEVSVADDVRRYGSVALFLLSARRTDPKGFGKPLGSTELGHVTRICQLAQGMPLAILLAAAWVPALTPAEIAAEMEQSLDFLAADWRDEPERHHSMRAVFDATWGMLTEGEREAFARLSVFRGGFTREAAQAVAGVDLRTLVSLVTKSLLQRDRSERYEIHELLRQYGEGQLVQVPEERERTLDLHSTYYAEFLQRREADLRKGHVEEALAEIDNLRFAWQRTIAQHKIADIHKCVLGLCILYQGTGLLHEGQALFAEAADALRPKQAEELDTEHGAAFGLVLVMHGFFSTYLGQAEEGRELIEESLSLLRRLGARRELAFAYGIAVAAGVLEVEDLPDAKQLLEERAALSSELNDDLAAAWTLWLLGRVALRLGANEDAERYCREALSVSRRIDDDYDAAFALVFLGHTLYRRGEYVGAMQCFEDSLALFVKMRQGYVIGRLHSHLGDAALALRQYESARQHHQHALSVYKEIDVYWVEEHIDLGASWGVPVSVMRLGDVALAEGNGHQARGHYRQALQMAMERPYSELYLHLLLGPARLLAQEGHVEKAVEVAALARHYPASVEETRNRADELLDGLRSELLPDAYAAAEARGRARDLEAMVRELLVELAPSAGSGMISGGSDQVDTARGADTGEHGNA